MDTDLIIGCKYRYLQEKLTAKIAKKEDRWRGFAIRAKIKALGHGLQPSSHKGTDYKSAPASTASSSKPNPRQHLLRA